MMTSVRNGLAMLAAALLLACAPAEDLSAPPEPLGEFSLGYNIAVARSPQVSPVSRKATQAEWEGAMTAAVAERFGRFTGRQQYHLGINIDGFALAPPGIPLVLKPRSVLIVSANVWDAAAGRKINVEPEQITVFESTTGETFIGSGLTQTKEEQMRNLSRNAARQIEAWLRAHPEWFALRAGATATATAAAAPAGIVPPAGTVAPSATEPVTAAPTN